MATEKNLKSEINYEHRIGKKREKERAEMDLETRRKLRLVLRSELLNIGELSGNAVV